MGYTGLEEVRSPEDYVDDLDRMVKKRARARHETLNARLKNFNILSHVFRADYEKHRMYFMAVAAVVQASINDGWLLFQV